MEAHDYAAVFPMGTDAEVAEMAADIKRRGLLHPIVVFDGKILDGRNRFRACGIANITPDFTDYVGTDPLGDVVSWNLHRRQLSTSQRAAIAVELKPMFEAQARERMKQAEGRPRGEKSAPANLPEQKSGEARDQAAAAMGVSGRSVAYAEQVKRTDPEKFEQIKSGQKTVHAASQEVAVKKRRPETKPRGSFDDWEKLRDLVAGVGDAANMMERLRVDMQHRIPARTLCEKLASRFSRLAQTLGGE